MFEPRVGELGVGGCDLSLHCTCCQEQQCTKNRKLLHIYNFLYFLSIKNSLCMLLCLPLCMFLCSSHSMFLCSSHCMFLCLPLYLSLCLSLCLSLYLSLYLPLCLSLCLPLYLPLYMSLCSSLCSYNSLSNFNSQNPHNSPTFPPSKKRRQKYKNSDTLGRKSEHFSFKVFVVKRIKMLIYVKAYKEQRSSVTVPAVRRPPLQ